MAWQRIKSAAEFRAAYEAQPGVSVEQDREFPGRLVVRDDAFFGGHSQTCVILPCNCGEPNCESWAMVPVADKDVHMATFMLRERSAA